MTLEASLPGPALEENDNHDFPVIFFTFATFFRNRSSTKYINVVTPGFPPTGRVTGGGESTWIAPSFI
jgi:hypothetical protein